MWCSTAADPELCLIQQAKHFLPLMFEPKSPTKGSPLPRVLNLLTAQLISLIYFPLLCNHMFPVRWSVEHRCKVMTANDKTTVNYKNKTVSTVWEKQQFSYLSNLQHKQSLFLKPVFSLSLLIVSVEGMICMICSVCVPSHRKACQPTGSVFMGEVRDHEKEMVGRCW